MQGFQESKRSKWIIMLCFFLIIWILPLIELGKEIYHKEHIIELDIFRGIPTNEKVRSYEKAIEDNSIIAKFSRKWLQLLLTCFGDQGNKKVIIGRDRWLFYRPSFDYATKPIDNFYGDSRPFQAITAFNNALKEQNVVLILLPIPGKSSIYPEYLSKRYKSELNPPVNIYADEFFQKLRDEGIKIVDPTSILWEAKKTQDEMLYLEQDTHWSPEGMSLVAQYLSDFIITNGLIDGIYKEAYKTKNDKATRYGDLYDMLGFPEGYNNCYQPKSIEIEKVINLKTNEPFKPDQNSPIVLLGDSFVNIFSKTEMGWGEDAGFAEHLALNLGIPIDVIALNDGGATGSREQLARRPNALLGKKLVIWQFPTRDLTNPESQWKIVNIPKPQKIAKKIELPKSQKPIDIEKEISVTEPIKQEEPKQDNLIVTGEVILVSNVPDPSQVAYSDCLTYIKYRVVSVENGEYKDNEIIAVFWGMQKSKLMPAAKFQIGEKHRLVLDPLSNHQDLAHFMQADDTNDYERTPYWVIEMSKQ